jgi:S-DNA-T family DNA segregation ATPase FtsK/SpoIIIE
MSQSIAMNELFRTRGIDASVVKVTTGLRTHKYYVKLGSAERVSKIRGLDEDLMLHLKTKTAPVITIEDGYVVLEVVHTTNAIQIPLHTLLHQVDISRFNLPLVIGTTMQHSPFVIDLADSNSPHLLIGGTTGSGKSVLLKTIAESLILRYPLKDKKANNFGAELILIDPKGTELRDYQHSDHTLSYCTTYEEACLALEQAVEVMETRYKLFPIYKTSNLTELRSKVQESDNQYIVIIIDELADLLLQDNKKRMKTALTRLTQKSKSKKRRT